MVREPEWEDPQLTVLARRLREAHAQVAAVSGLERPRLTRNLLVITDLAKRDPELAAERLESFMNDLGAAGNRA